MRKNMKPGELFRCDAPAWTFLGRKFSHDLQKDDVFIIVGPTSGDVVSGVKSAVDVICKFGKCSINLSINTFESVKLL